MERDPDWPDWVGITTFYEWAATILINGDDPPTSEEQDADVDRFLEFIHPAYVVDVVFESDNYCRPECGGLPGKVVEYIIHYPH